MDEQARGALLGCAAIGATLFTLIALGHDGRRVVQLMALAAPALVWLTFPVQSHFWHRVRSGVVWLWAMGFAFDGMTRAYLLEAYQAAPDSSLVQSAAANTNAREAAEYLSMHWRAMLLGAGAMLAAGLIFARYARQGVRGAARWPRPAMLMLAAMLLVTSLAYLSKPWRRLHPAVFWTHWSQSVLALRADWADRQHERELALARARTAKPVVARDGPSTLVLVITDSVNRDNLSLYGYQRPTSPRLLAHKSQLREQMLVLRNAWSVDASTLPSLRNIFHFGQPASQAPQHLLALARAAGYKVWWMSNHDDIAIDQQHARFADVVEFANRVPGRAGASLDGELLDCVQEALEDPAQRKLIAWCTSWARIRTTACAFPRARTPSTTKSTTSRKTWPSAGVPPGCASSGRSTTLPCCTTTSSWPRHCS